MTDLADNLPIIVIAFIVISLLVLGSFSYWASYGDANKAVFHLLWYLSPVLIGTVIALAAKYQG